MNMNAWSFVLAATTLVIVPLVVRHIQRASRQLLRAPCGCNLVVKLGGSAITDKSSFETLNKPALESTASALAHSRWARSMVLLHGAGSFGHFQASQYGVSKGASDPRFSWLGFAETRSSVTRLNSLVVSAMLRASLPACGLPLFPRWTTRAKKLQQDGIPEVCELLRAGIVPVLHGDAVLDSEQGSAVLSGDALVVALCQALRPERVVFLTNVAGVYDRPPDQPGARLLSRIVFDRSTYGVRELYFRSESGASERLKGGLATSTAAHDVTGGLAAKLEAAAKCAAYGTPVYIVQVGTEDATAALTGETPRVYTLIEAH
jgi:isopentenyl phosphate kinase